MLVGLYCILNRRDKTDFESTLQPDPPAKFRFDLNINFRMLEMNLDFYPSAFLAHLFSLEDERLHPHQVDSKNLQ